MLFRSDSTLARLSQGTTPGRLTAQVQHLSKPRFIELLELIIQEFEYFLKAINLINNQSLETLLEELLEAFTLKIGQILEADRTTIFIVDEENQELWSIISGTEDMPEERTQRLHSYAKSLLEKGDIEGALLSLLAG